MTVSFIILKGILGGLCMVRRGRSRSFWLHQLHFIEVIYFGDIIMSTWMKKIPHIVFIAVYCLQRNITAHIMNVINGKCPPPFIWTINNIQYAVHKCPAYVSWLFYKLMILQQRTLTFVTTLIKCQIQAWYYISYNKTRILMHMPDIKIINLHNETYSCWRIFRFGLEHHCFKQWNFTFSKPIAYMNQWYCQQNTWEETSGEFE